MKNLNYLLTVCCLIGFVNLSNAQNQDSVDVDVLFSQLDSSRVPTGILMDKVLAAGPSFYKNDGINSEMPILNSFGVLDNFWLLNHGSMNGPSIPHTLELIDSAHSYLARKGSYTIILADHDFNYIDSLAIQDSLITLNDSVFIDGPKFQKSPYRTSRFINSTVLDSFYVSSASFVFEQDFYFSNSGIPQSIEVDFGDGQGFRSASFGVALTPNFSEFNATYNGKRAIFTVRIKKNNTWSTTKFKVNTIDCSASTQAPTPSPAPWYSGNNFRFGNISTSPFDISQVVEGNAYVHYRPDILPGEENLFKRPFIIIEGFETGNYDPNKAENYRMGDFGWCELWGSSFGILGGSPLQKSPTLFNQLHNDGYDIIMLDFKDSKRSLIQNAALVRELIQRVNQFKTVDSDPNIVLGASAGGVISRYALAYMEKHNEDHCTNLWLSVDAPYQGANISLGAQYLLSFMANNNVQTVSQAQIMHSALGTQAALELLIYNVYQSNLRFHSQTANNQIEWLVDAPSAEHLVFRAALNQIGYPQKLQKIAIASGSKIMQNQGFVGVTKLYELSANYNGWKKGAYVHGRIKLDYWDSSPILMEGKMSYTANPWYALFAPVVFKKDNKEFRNPNNLPSIDRVPGGSNQLSKEIAHTVQNTDLGGYNVTFHKNSSYFDNQCFVPSISALDLNTTDYFENIFARVNNESLPTPFDEIYAPDLNTFHVEITDGSIPRRGDNIAYALNKVLLAQPVSNTRLASSYNYGEESTISHNEILANAQLLLYGNSNDSKTGKTPTIGKTHTYKLGSGCIATDLSINQDGELVLGDESVNNKAELIVLDGASLTIKNKGKLIIKDESSLIISDGGSLIIEEGAIIELPGYFSTITVKGKLSVGANASLSVNGHGKLIFNQDVPWITNTSNGNSYLKLDDYWDIGHNAKIDLQGPSVRDPNHSLIEVYKPVYLKMEDGTTFSEVILKNGRIALHKDAFLFSFSPTSMRGVTFNAAIANEPHEGFRLWNNTGFNSIINCKFLDGNHGAIMHWIGGGDPISFTNCEFEGNTIGLKVQGGNFVLNNCDYLDNATALKGINLSGQSQILNSSIEGLNNLSQNGANIHAQIGGSLVINSSKFSNCIDGLSLSGDINARSSCSEYSINGSYGININGNAKLDISNSAENIFASNSTADVNMDGSHHFTALYIDEGRNDFAPRGINDGSYIKGRFAFGAPSFLSGANFIDANNNKMPTYILGGQVFMPVDFTYRLDPNSSFETRVGVNIPMNLSLVSRSCESSTATTAAVSTYYGLVQAIPGTGGTINNSDFPNKDLKFAILSAINKISIGEDQREDTKALVELIGILGASVNNPDAHTAKMKAIAYDQMHRALNIVYQGGDLKNVQGENGVINDTIQDAINLIDDYLTDLNLQDSSQHFLNFKYHLDKIHVLRVSGYYSNALNILQGNQSWTYSPEQLDQASYWNCVCSTESAYYGDEISEEEFANEISICNMNNYGMNFKKEVEASSVGFPMNSEFKERTINLFPIPASEHLNIESNQYFEGIVKISISEINGALLSDDEIHWSSSLTTVPISHLKPGAYLIRLQFENEKGVFLKFIKQ